MSYVEIKDLGYDRIVKELLSLNNKSIKAGLLDNTGNRATIAFWQEKGTVNIPARPFMLTTMVKNENKYINLFSKNVKNIIEGTLRGDDIFNKLGLEMKKDIQKSIIDWDTPKNKATTIKRKGFNDPLIHTRLMLGLIKYKLI